jgi:hypothetical protein
MEAFATTPVTVNPILDTIDASETLPPGTYLLDEPEDGEVIITRKLMAWQNLYTMICADDDVVSTCIPLIVWLRVALIGKPWLVQGIQSLSNGSLALAPLQLYNKPNATANTALICHSQFHSPGLTLPRYGTSHGLAASCSTSLQ